MLNFTDFMGLLMLLAGPLSGFGAAHQRKAGLVSLVLFTIFGLIVGVGLGQISSQLAYSVLRSKTMPKGLQAFAYMLVPATFLFAVLLVPALLALIIYG